MGTRCALGLTSNASLLPMPRSQRCRTPNLCFPPQIRSFLVWVWRKKSAKGVQWERAAKLKGHTKSVRAVAFHPGGRIVVSASDDAQVSGKAQVGDGAQLPDLSHHVVQDSSVGYRFVVWGSNFGIIRTQLAPDGNQHNLLQSYR